MSVKYKDYYKILGISSEATGFEVKSAYRRLARKYHPDLNKDDASAEQRFKEVQEAYDVLNDDAKRRQYDTLDGGYQDGMEFQMPGSWQGRAGTGQPAGQPAAGGFSEFFEVLFGGGPRRSRTPRQNQAVDPGPTPSQENGRDVETSMTVTLEEAYAGVAKRARMHVNKKCSDCDGSGRTSSGECESCGGRGVKAEPRQVEIRVPAGIKDGTRLRFTGWGEPPMNGSGKPGDLFVKVTIDQHPIFTLKGSNVHIELPVAPWEAVLGAEVDVPTLGGHLKMKLPPGSQTGKKMRLKGRGMPTGETRGDEIVLVKVVVPTDLTDRERHLFRQLRDISHFRPRVKSRTAY